MASLSGFRLNAFRWLAVFGFAAAWLVATIAIRLLRHLPWTLAAVAGAAAAALLVISLNTGRALRGGRDLR